MSSSFQNHNANQRPGSSGDYAAPSHPPPPRVPDGWAVRWDDNYHRFYYVNLATKASQWDVPEGTVFSDDPPSYQHSITPPRTPDPSRRAEHTGSPAPGVASSSNPAHQPEHKSFGQKVGDFLEKRAAKKQAYYANRPMMVMGPRPMMGGYGGGMYGRPMYGPGYGGYPGMMGGGYGRRPGMGAGGAAMLGAGGGLLGGMMLADAMDDRYEDGYEQGMDDYGGGDFDSGDFGGGDFGGGDF